MAINKRSNWVLFLSYFVFIYCIYAVDSSGDNYRVASWLNWKFWVPSIVFFFVGLGGFRKGMHFTASNWAGARFSGFIDQGSVEGTAGLRGAVSLSLAYMSVYLVMALASVMALKKTYVGMSGMTTLVVGAILFVLIIPLYFLFLYLLRSEKMIPTIIFAAWAIFLIIVSRI